MPWLLYTSFFYDVDHQLRIGNVAQGMRKETGDRRQVTGDRIGETGDGKQEIHNDGRPEMGQEWTWEIRDRRQKSRRGEERSDAEGGWKTG